MQSSNRTRVLVVEDEAVIAELLSDLLEEAGFDVAWCKEGEEALEAQRSFPCEVAIVDYGLPDMNGLEVCQQLGPTRAGARPKVILATGWGLLEEAQTRGIVDLLLQKPFNTRDIVAQVSRLAEGG